MTKNRFLSTRRESWKRFETLLSRSERRRWRWGWRLLEVRLSGEEAAEFSHLFRQVCYDLATVRSRDWGLGLERYLNHLVKRGHGSFYRSPPGKPRDVMRFLTSGFPRLFRREWRYFAVASALFFGPFILCAILVAYDAELARRVLPASTLFTLDEMYQDDISGTGAEAGMAGFYVFNNVGISFRCFATGALLGLGTAYVLVFNGIFLGTVTGYMVAVGNSGPFFSFVISHGSFELTAIAVSGGAGLVLGHSLVHPGKLSRLDALLVRGRVSLKLAAGAAAMLIVAAAIEAFWSPSELPNSVKYVGGTAFWILVFLYLGFAGRERRRP